MEDFLPQNEIFEQDRPPLTHPQAILVIRDRHAVICSQCRATQLLGFACIPNFSLIGLTCHLCCIFNGFMA